MSQEKEVPKHPAMLVLRGGELLKKRCGAISGQFKEKMLLAADQVTDEKTSSLCTGTQCGPVSAHPSSQQPKAGAKDNFYHKREREGMWVSALLLAGARPQAPILQIYLTQSWGGGWGREDPRGGSSVCSPLGDKGKMER